jgi:microcystin-dependent protein
MPIGMNHNTFSVNAQEESTLEIGAIYGSARSSTPSGYLLCDGSAVSRTTYANLFSAIGTSFGTGNNSTTFNIPDGRGGTLRGAGTSSGYTENVTVTLGTKDNDSMQGHRHSDSGHVHPFINGLITGYGGDVRNTDGVGNVTWGIQTQTSTASANIAGPTTDAPNGTPRATSETKMKNIGINFFIKF